MRSRRFLLLCFPAHLPHSSPALLSVCVFFVDGNMHGPTRTFVSQWRGSGCVGPLFPGVLVTVSPPLALALRTSELDDASTMRTTCARRLRTWPTRSGQETWHCVQACTSGQHVSFSYHGRDHDGLFWKLTCCRGVFFRHSPMGIV